MQYIYTGFKEMEGSSKHGIKGKRLEKSMAKNVLREKII